MLGTVDAMAGRNRKSTLARVIAPATLALACSDPEPEMLYSGRWIDIAGIGVEPADTCAGTFAYVDAYAGVIAAEFGIDAPLGTFVWYTPEEYDELLPCGEHNQYPGACAIEDTIHSAILPHEHEIVHIANFYTGLCPDPLSEGLAVYYSHFVHDGHKMDFDALAVHLAEPGSAIPHDHYEMLGRLAGFLVEEYGLDAVLEVCATVGRNASGEELARAMESILGARPEDVIAALSAAPPECNDFRIYRSKAFACGAAPAAEHLGVMSENFDTVLEFGCDRPGSVYAPFSGEIQRFFSFEVPVEDVYMFMLREETSTLVRPDITVEISRCGPCQGVIHSYDDGPYDTQFPLIVLLEPGRYSLEIRLPRQFNGSLELDISR